MFHASNFGGFATELKAYADLNGQVPEEGDEPGAFSWPHDDFTANFDRDGNGYEGYAAEKWEEHVAAAVEATERASAALEEWRTANV